MKRYEAYKPVTSRWAKQLPFYWEFQKIAEVFIERKENNDPIKTTNILSLTNTRGVIPYSDKGNLGNKAKNDIRGYRLAYPGDIVLNSMNVVIGSVGLSQYYGAVSPVYCMLYVRNNTKYNVRYYNYVFQDKIFQGGLNGLGNGILEIRMRIPMSKLKYVCVPVPPRDEQDQIVRYLDWQVSKINRLIAAKRKEIDLTREYLSVKIEDAFNSVIGTSSVMLPLGRYIRKIESGTSVNSIMGSANAGAPGVLSTSCVYGNCFNASQNKQVAPIDYERVSCPVRKDTVIVSRMNTPSLVGACGYSDKDIDNVFLPDRLWQVYFNDTLMPEFVWRYLSRQSVQSWFATIATGSSNTMKNITKLQFKTVLIPNIDLEKQKRVTEIIRKIMDKRNTSCQLYEKTISNLQDLRTRLISDVVTGQMDVRSIEVPEFEYVGEVMEANEVELEDSEEVD